MTDGPLAYTPTNGDSANMVRWARVRDVHAAMVCLWWVSINMLGVAIYMADARAGRLMLLNGPTGQESDAHDWNNLRARGDGSRGSLISAPRPHAVQ